MSVKTIVVEGTAEWAKVFPSNRDMKGFEGAYEDCGGAYTIDVVLDSDEAEKLTEAGSIKQGSVTEDGLKFKFVRKHEGPFAEVSGPPIVIDSDDNPWDIESMGFIGNGSKVRLKLSIYDTKYRGRKGTRLDAVRVLEHVPHFPEGTEDDIPF